MLETLAEAKGRQQLYEHQSPQVLEGESFFLTSKPLPPVVGRVLKGFSGKIIR